jgi:hypothetical protein
VFPYYPPDTLVTVAVFAGISWLIHPRAGSFVTLAVFILPVAYHSPTLALVYLLFFLLLSILDIELLGAYGMLILCGVTTIAMLAQGTPVLLAVPLLAGFLGARRGALMGGITCLWLEVINILGGKSQLGLLVLTQPPTSSFILKSGPITSLADFGWFLTWWEARKIDTELLSGLFAPLIQQPVLLIQIGLWAVSAGFVGFLLSRKLPIKIPNHFLSIGLGAIVLGGGTLMLANLYEATSLGWDVLLPSILVPAGIVAVLAPLLDLASLRKPFPTLSFSMHGLKGSKEDESEPETSHYDVFLSHSSKDRTIVEGYRSGLEAEGIRCWIAPRDIRPGEDFPTAIAKAISSSQIMLLVFSQNSNLSEEVSRELYLAASQKLIILPIRIEPIEPEPGKAYYLNRVEWLEATLPPTSEQIAEVVQKIRALLQSNAKMVLDIHSEIPHNNGN